jgi:uncharacterized protein (TIRG00374 family)
LLRITIGLGLLAYIVSQWSDAQKAAFFRIETPLILSIVSLTFFGGAIECLRLKMLCRAQEVYLSFKRGFLIVAVGTFFNFCIPGGTGGDVVKLYYLASNNPKKALEVAAVFLVDRVVGLFSILVMAIILSLFSLELVSGEGLARWVFLVTLALTVTIVSVSCLFLSRYVRASRLFEGVLSWMPFGQHVRRITDALYIYRHHKMSLAWAFIYSIVGHMGLLAAFILLGSFLYPGAPPATVCFLSLLGLLVNAIPLTPGGLGVGEVAFETLFAQAGYPGAALLILLWRVGMLPLALSGGAFYIIGLRSEKTFSSATGRV